mmetsp:Transcript_10481/g.15706  ORF Transcript_10481/g.15706 Transcript_10481/m.15706 type:complete len:538 (+) Transcript_10481:90-1703(+)
MVFIYGVLHKKSLMMWKERFFVLRGSTLSCFKKKGDAEPTKVYSLTGEYGVEQLSKGSGFVFRTPTKTLKLKAPSVKEESEWISTLQTVINNERDKICQKPLRCGTKLWWAETKQGQFCFELDDYYEMKKTIGSGGYGIVVSAVDKRTSTKVAIKKVVGAFDDVLVAKRMVREIRLLRQFDHENVIRIVDMLPPPTMEHFNDVYIVLERMDTDLHHIIYSGQHLKEAHMQFFMYQMLCGLNYLHSAQVIHRDLKPANILVNTTCDLKLCDFGLARSLQNTNADNTSNDDEAGAKMTEYVVTRWWRAPEVFLEAEYNVAIDIWSAGCILAEMLQKKPLFMGSNTAQMLKLIVQFCGKDNDIDLSFVANRKARSYILDMQDCTPVDLPSKFPNSGANALDLLGQMLQFNPNKRITIDEALQHPWLSNFRSAQNEVPALNPVNLEEVETTPLSRGALQKLMFEDVLAFRPDCATDPNAKSQPLTNKGPPNLAIPLPPIVYSSNTSELDVKTRPKNKDNPHSTCSSCSRSPKPSIKEEAET